MEPETKTVQGVKIYGPSNKVPVLVNVTGSFLIFDEYFFFPLSVLRENSKAYISVQGLIFPFKDFKLLIKDKKSVLLILRRAFPNDPPPAVSSQVSPSATASGVSSQVSIQRSPSATASGSVVKQFEQLKLPDDEKCLNCGGPDPDSYLCRRGEC